MRYVFLLLGFAALATCEDVFVYPPPANTFPIDASLYPRLQLGSTIELKWSSSLSIISIGLRHITDPILLTTGAAQGNILENQPNENGTSWKVEGNGNIETDPTYYLAGVSEDESSYFTSNYFIIEQPSVSSSSSSTISAPTSSTSSTSASQTPASQTSNSQTSTSQTPTSTPPPSNSGLSTGAKAGIGAGVPLGIAAIGLAAILLYRRGVKKGQSAGPPGEGYTRGINGEWYTAKMDTPESEGQNGRWVVSHEMPVGDGPRHEMPVDHGRQGY